MPVHQCKKEAIFQLCNFLCVRSVSNIQELADGDIFHKTIQIKFPEFLNDLPDTCPESKSSNDENKVIQLSNKESDGINENSDNESFKEKEKLSRFYYIQKFIDNHYKIKSDEIISYSECTKSNELELTKIAVFVLSEIVKHSLEVNNEHLQTLFHLEVKFQVELEDCFRLFISEREKISKDIVEKLLSKSSKKAIFMETPRRTSLRTKEQKSASPPKPPPQKEDVFTNSPLKVYFESPVFKKEDIIKKDKEIKHLKKVMSEEEEEASKLQYKLSEMQKELKKKEKDCKKLQKQVAEMNKEIEVLQNSCNGEICKIEKEKLLTDLNMSKSNATFLTERILEKTNELAELHKILNEEETIEGIDVNEIKSRSFSQPSKIIVPMSPTMKENLQREIQFLKEKVKSLELKVFSYKKQLSRNILTDIKEKKEIDNANRDYEKIWNELNTERENEAENMGLLIEEDNRMLCTKINELNFKNKKLLEEIEVLKESTSKNEISNQEKVSVATMTVALSLPELIDTSETPEMEKLRNSYQTRNVEHCHLSDEPSYILNNSCNLFPCEQSVVSSEPEVISNLENSSEAVLWNMYVPQKPETESIHLEHDSVVSENLHLDVINCLDANIKTENGEADIILSHENKYILGNLNFDVFLNELKKLTKNGSFQKVLQVFGKRQKEINGTNKSHRLDLQEMLKMITECVCTAVALNAESSFPNLQDKCCSTNEKEFYNSNQNIELDQLKNEINAASQKHAIELKQQQNELEKLTEQNNLLEMKLQACDHMLLQTKRAKEEAIKKYNDQKQKLANFERKNKEHKEAVKRLLDVIKKQHNDNFDIKNRACYLYKKRNMFEKYYKELKDENNQLKQELQKLKEEKGRKSSKSDVCSRDLFPSRNLCVEIPNHVNIKPELQSSLLQDTANESILSGAFHKSISHYVSENEDDFCYYSSLDTIKKESMDDRLGELMRRNSLLPLHLQSAYPIEANLDTTYESLYVKDGEKSEEDHCSKKRKLDVLISEESSTNSTFDTPVTKRPIGSPKSFKKFMRYMRMKKMFKKPEGS